MIGYGKAVSLSRRIFLRKKKKKEPPSLALGIPK